MDKNSKIVVGCIITFILGSFVLMISLIILGFFLYQKSDTDSSKSIEEIVESPLKDEEVVGVTEERIMIEDKGYLYFNLPEGWTYDYDRDEFSDNPLPALSFDSEGSTVYSYIGIYYLEYPTITEEENKTLIIDSAERSADQYVSTEIELFAYEGDNIDGYYTNPFEDKSLVGVETLPNGEYRYLVLGGMRLSESSEEFSVSSLYLDSATISEEFDSEDHRTMMSIFETFRFEENQ